MFKIFLLDKIKLTPTVFHELRGDSAYWMFAVYATKYEQKVSSKTFARLSAVMFKQTNTIYCGNSTILEPSALVHFIIMNGSKYLLNPKLSMQNCLIFPAWHGGLFKH